MNYGIKQVNNGELSSCLRNVTTFVFQDNRNLEQRNM